MKKITLYIGLNDRETKTQLISTLDAYRIVNNILGTDSEGVSYNTIKHK